MKLLIAAIVISVSTVVLADEYVKGHVKSDGTYVQGHYKTEANDTKTDNYSSKPNVNPYTGKKGTVDPYKQDDDPYSYKAPKPAKRGY